MQSYNEFAKTITEACWKGYERTPGTKEGEDGSCRKKGTKKKAKKKVEEAQKGLYHNINKRKKAGTSRPKGHPDAPSDEDFKNAAKTAKESKDKKKVEEAKCDGPTKKASSTSKGKKWMQCVKNPDGEGYKRVHWGQKGVRVTGKSGNTKRKKSFRARHKCSSAKAGTARAQACKDW